MKYILFILTSDRDASFQRNDQTPELELELDSFTRATSGSSGLMARIPRNFLKMGSF